MSAIQKHQEQQQKQDEWHYQWKHYSTDTDFLFHDWIAPRTLEDFRGKRVLDAGCGAGHHVRIVAPVAAHITGMDLNTDDIAASKLAEHDNVSVQQGDIATYQPDEPLDVVYCVGVIHHTDDPDRTFVNLKRMVRDGGLLIIWCYSREGNALVRWFVEPLRIRFLQSRSRRVIGRVSWLLTALMYPFVYTLYRLPLRWLPYYEYFQNFRKMDFERNMLNVFDKLNAPQTDFISRERIEAWFAEGFEDVSITPYKGVSWRGSGVVRHD